MEHGHPLSRKIYVVLRTFLMESDLFGDIMYHIIMNDSGAFVMTSEDGFNPLYEKIGDADNGYSSS